MIKDRHRRNICFWSILPFNGFIKSAFYNPPGSRNRQKNPSQKADFIKPLKGGKCMNYDLLVTVFNGCLRLKEVQNNVEISISLVFKDI